MSGLGAGVASSGRHDAAGAMAVRQRGVVTTEFEREEGAGWEGKGFMFCVAGGVVNSCM